MTHHDTSISGFYRPMNFWDFGISGPKLSETPGRGSFWVRLHAEPISSQSMRVWESSQAKSKRSAISRENVWILGSYWDPIGILLGSYWDPIWLYHISCMFVSYFSIFYQHLWGHVRICLEALSHGNYDIEIIWMLLNHVKPCQTSRILVEHGQTWESWNMAGLVLKFPLGPYQSR